METQRIKKRERFDEADSMDEIDLSRTSEIEFDDTPNIDIIGFFEALANAWLDKNGLRIILNQVKKEKSAEVNEAETTIPTRKGCVIKRK